MRSRSHGVPRALVEAQAKALGLPCVLPTASWQTYEIVFGDALRDLRAQVNDEIVFGDIDLDPHRDVRLTVEVFGPLSWLWNRLVARKQAAEAEVSAKALARYAEQRW